jgi:hypothetical protein
VSCEKCGQDHGGKCTGHSKRTKAKCNAAPMHGQDICRMHGGRTRQALSAAKDRLDEQRYAIELGRLTGLEGAPSPVDNPLTELALIAGEARRFMQWCRGRLTQLQEDQLRYEDAKGSEQLRSEVALYERAMDRCATVLATIARLGIDERLVVIEERKAAMVVAAIQAALDAADVPRDKQAAAKKAAAKHLRLVDAS